MVKTAMRMRKVPVILMALLLIIPVFAQEKPAGKQETAATAQVQVTASPTGASKDETKSTTAEVEQSQTVTEPAITEKKDVGKGRNPGDYFSGLAAWQTASADSSGVGDKRAEKSKTFDLSASNVTNLQAPAGGAAGQAQPSPSDAADLAKKSQNPVSDLISVPFQSNWNYGVGPERRTQYVLNIQPVIPIKLSENWNLITRVILPITYLPIGPSDSEKGIGDTALAMFFSPSKPGKVIWGIGPQFLLRTASDTNLGSGKWGAGPTIVALTMPGHFVLGVLASNTWSFAGASDREQVNLLSVQYFINYNLPKARGFAITSAPTIQANWRAPNDQRWVVPFGGGIAQTFVAGKQPMSLGFQLYYNAVRPDNAPNWNLRFQFSLLFPKKG